MANKRQPVPGVTDTVITFSPTVLSEVPEGDSRAFGNEDAATRPVVLGDLFDDDHRPIRFGIADVGHHIGDRFDESLLLVVGTTFEHTDVNEWHFGLLETVRSIDTTQGKQKTVVL